jgi:hypothetical protein
MVESYGGVTEEIKQAYRRPTAEEIKREQDKVAKEVRKAVWRKEAMK